MYRIVQHTYHASYLCWYNFHPIWKCDHNQEILAALNNTYTLYLIASLACPPEWSEVSRKPRSLLLGSSQWRILPSPSTLENFLSIPSQANPYSIMRRSWLTLDLPWRKISTVCWHGDEAAVIRTLGRSATWGRQELRCQTIRGRRQADLCAPTRQDVEW